MPQRPGDADPTETRFAQIERTLGELRDGQAGHSTIFCRMVDCEFSDPVSEGARKKLIDVFRHAMANHRWSVNGIRGVWSLFIALCSGTTAALTTWLIDHHGGGLH